MGLDSASIKFLCAAKSFGVDFSNLLMIGRQSLFAEESALHSVFSVLGVDADAKAFLRANEYGEEFFSLLGAREINSLDYSTYEDATIVHDMNAPIPDELGQRFSVVYDGGTLEHVFNVPQALKNCLEMVQVGGYFVQANVANNFMGHGFWQFSPELIFRVCSPENGFEVHGVFLHEVKTRGGWYSVSDPREVGQRVFLCNSAPTYILTIAKKTSAEKIFANPPLQSDYSAIWNQTSDDRSDVQANDATHVPTKANQPFRLRRYLPDPVKRVFRSCGDRLRTLKRRGPFDRPYYRNIPEANLLRGLLE